MAAGFLAPGFDLAGAFLLSTVFFGSGLAFPAFVAAGLDFALAAAGATLVFLAGGGGDLAAFPRPRLAAADGLASSSFYCLLVLIFYIKEGHDYLTFTVYRWSVW